MPYDDLIEGVSLSADKLIISLGEDKVADLGACVDRMQWLHRESVPEPNVLVSCPTTRRQ